MQTQPHPGTPNGIPEAIINLRGLLRQIGRHEFRAYGYAEQLRSYRQATR